MINLFCGVPYSMGLEDGVSSRTAHLVVESIISLVTLKVKFVVLCAGKAARVPAADN